MFSALNGYAPLKERQREPRSQEKIVLIVPGGDQKLCLIQSK